MCAFQRLQLPNTAQAHDRACLVNANLKKSEQDHLLISSMSRRMTLMKTGNAKRTPMLIQLTPYLAKSKKTHSRRRSKAILRTNTRLLLSKESRTSSCADRPRRYSWAPKKSRCMAEQQSLIYDHNRPSSRGQSSRDPLWASAPALAYTNLICPNFT